MFESRHAAQAFVSGGQNPDQKVEDNLPATAATRVIGGMGTHWTCCTPGHCPDIELSTLFNTHEWKKLYGRAESLFGTTSSAFSRSIRQGLLMHVLNKGVPKDGRRIKPMPLSCKRSETNDEYVHWGCTATILGDLAKSGHTSHVFRAPF